MLCRVLAASNTRREQGASLQKFFILLKVSDFFHSYSTRDSAANSVMSLEEAGSKGKGTSSSSGDGGTSSAAGLATEGVRTPLSEEDFKRITDAVISALRAPAAPAASGPSISTYDISQTCFIPYTGKFAYASRYSACYKTKTGVNGTVQHNMTSNNYTNTY